MRCKTCDYRLWNLTARACPECGTAFKPSEFRFQPNSVRFCCPHCRQPYYGTDANGLLQPRTFECVGCHTVIDLDEMALEPAEGMHEEKTQVEDNPWLTRARTGSVKSWFKTIGRSMTQPLALIRATPLPPDSTAITALWFLIVTAFIMQFAMSGACIALPLIGFLTSSGNMGLDDFLGFGMFVIGPFAFTMIVALVWASVTHVVLKLGGPTAGGFGRTLQALCYSSGPLVIGAIPCFGIYTAWIGYIWWIVVGTIMVIEAQKVSGLRGTLATLAAPVVGTILTVAAIVTMIVISIQAANQMTANFQQHHSVNTWQVWQVQEALHGHALMNNGAGPEHAARLILTESLDPTAFIVQGSHTPADRVTIDTRPLDAFATLNLGQQHAAVNAAAKALPHDVIAHRLGDYVFTYHGINLDSPPDYTLWTFIAWNDPDHNPPSTTVIVGLADETPIEFTAADFPAQLQAQNALRIQHNLPPLPDPATVTHAKPAAPAVENP